MTQLSKREKKQLINKIIPLFEGKRFFIAIFDDNKSPIVSSNGNTDDISRLKDKVDESLRQFYEINFPF